MTTPTKEQRRAASDALGRYADTLPPMEQARLLHDEVVDVVAALLAEREAPLRERILMLEAIGNCDPKTDPCGGCFACVAAMREQVENNIRLRVAAEERCREMNALAISERERAEKAERELAIVDAKLRDRCEDLARVGLENVHNNARAEKAEAALADVEAGRGVVSALTYAARTQEREHDALANLATLQREHDALTRSTEGARAAIAQALGLTEWRALADLAADVARLTAERDEYRRDVADAAGELLVDIPEPGSEAAKLLLANVAMRRERDEANARSATAERRNQAVAENTTRMLSEHKAALAASRAEVEALRAFVKRVADSFGNSSIADDARALIATANAEPMHDEEHKFDRVAGVCLDCDYTEPRPPKGGEGLMAVKVCRYCAAEVGAGEQSSDIVHAPSCRLARARALSSTPASASADARTQQARAQTQQARDDVRRHFAKYGEPPPGLEPHGVDASAKPATPTTFAGRQMCNMTNCGGSVEMYWTAAYSKQGKCSRCNCAVQCSTTEAGPLATPTTEGGAK